MDEYNNKILHRKNENNSLTSDPMQKNSPPSSTWKLIGLSPYVRTAIAALYSSLIQFYRIFTDCCQVSIKPLLIFSHKPQGRK